MTRAHRMLAITAAVSMVMVTSGCGSDAGSAGGHTDDISATPPTPTQATTGVTRSAGEPAGLPTPPGAADWPVRDVADCKELGVIQEPELIVRVPVATGDCMNFSPKNEFLVVATRKIDFDTGGGRKVDVPGFDGTVRVLLGQMDRGVLRVVQPSGEDVRYLVVWDGGTDTTIDELIADLFVEQ